MEKIVPYKTKNKVRIVTAASLFDGHDAAINVMRRIIQASGCEVIHLGHDRSVDEVVNTAIQEDVQAIAMTSYQGGHTEYLKYMYDLLQERGAPQIKIFAGGGGTILPSEIEELQAYGITRIYHPDDGREMGLQGMINDLIEKSGGINILAEDNLTGWPEYSVETLIERNPDIIIAPSSLAPDPSVIINDPRFSSINAVIEGRVYIVPDNPVSRPSQNSIKALQMFSKAIHPEIFGEFEIIE